MKNSTTQTQRFSHAEYYRQLAAEARDLAAYYGRVPEDAQKAAGRKAALKDAEMYDRLAEEAEAAENAAEAANNNKEEKPMQKTQNERKTTTDIEIEIMRHNVTPAQFLAYVRKRVNEKGGYYYSSDLDLSWFKGESWCNYDYSYGVPGEKGALSEKSTDKPYQKQTYIMNFDGSVYNEIVEFDFWDEKTGTGYYYLVNKSVAEEDKDSNTLVSYEDAKRYYTRKIEESEKKIAKREKELEEGGTWISRWYAEMYKNEISYEKMSIENNRGNIAALDEAILALTGESEVSETETDSAERIRFEVGRRYYFEGLYGGRYTLDLVKRDEKTATFAEYWIAEDTGRECHKNRTFDIEIERIGSVDVERIEIWEYQGQKGYEYAANEELRDILHKESKGRENIDEDAYHLMFELIEDHLADYDGLMQTISDRLHLTDEEASRIKENLHTEFDLYVASYDPSEKIVREIEEKLEQRKTRSAWDRGVKEYALELIEKLKESVENQYRCEVDFQNWSTLEDALLNGASDWRQYSEGGCSLCYDGQIAERLCAPWELRKTDRGCKDPNSRERWIDVQSRALFQAAHMIRESFEAVRA